MAYIEPESIETNLRERVDKQLRVVEDGVASSVSLAIRLHNELLGPAPSFANEKDAEPARGWFFATEHRLGAVIRQQGDVRVILEALLKEVSTGNSNILPEHFSELLSHEKFSQVRREHQ